MKKHLLLLPFLVLALVACEEADQSTEATEEKEVAVEETESAEASAETEEKAPEEVVEESPEIDTSVFEYAQSIDLTDAIDLNEHVTLIINMSPELTPGLATQHVVNQTYDFIQQDDIDGARTVSFNVVQGDKKVAMYTVQRDDFTPNDEEPMADAVMAASEMEFMSPEVEEYGQVMGTW